MVLNSITIFAKFSNISLYHRSKDSDGPKTQFVVTLDSLGFPTKKPATQNDDTFELRRTNKSTFKAAERKRTPISNRIGKRSSETENESELRRAVENSSNKSPTSLKRKRTPIKFDMNDPDAKDIEPEKKRRSKSIDRKSVDNERKKSLEKTEERKRDSRSNERDTGEFNSKIRTLKTNNQNKYDNLPPRKYNFNENIFNYRDLFVFCIHNY